MVWLYLSTNASRGLALAARFSGLGRVALQRRGSSSCPRVWVGPGMNGHGEVVVKHFDDPGHQVGSPLFVNTDVEHEQPSSDRSLDGEPGRASGPPTVASTDCTDEAVFEAEAPGDPRHGSHPESIFTIAPRMVHCGYRAYCATAIPTGSRSPDHLAAVRGHRMVGGGGRELFEESNSVCHRPTM